MRRILDAGSVVLHGIGTLSITRKGALRPRSVIHFVPADTLVRALKELDDGDGEERGRWTEESDG